MKKLALVLGLGLMFVACSDDAKKEEAPDPAPQEQMTQNPEASTENPMVSTENKEVTEVPAENNTDVKPETEETPAPSEDQAKTDEQKEEKAQ